MLLCILQKHTASTDLFSDRIGRYLAKYEVRQMMVSMGYKVDKDYLDGLLDLFGDFDKARRQRPRQFTL